MKFLNFKISEKISEDSQEYLSMVDTKKSDSFYYLFRYFYSYIPHQKRKKGEGEDFHPNLRTFNIPVTTPTIHHSKEATIGFDGGIFFNGKYFHKILTKKSLEQRFASIQEMSICKIKCLEDLKRYIKNFYYRKISLGAYKKRKILNNPRIVKIMFFETAYENMYHFIFQYYPNIPILTEYCKKHGLDFRIIMPAKCNRKKQANAAYRGYINELMRLEGLSEDKMIFLDYQNYNVKNLIYTDSPIDSPEIVLTTMKKICNFFYKVIPYNRPTRIYISRKQANHRFLTNEEEVKKILEHDYGFTTFYMENHNLEEKVNIMSNAEIVISIDGTSLINGYFSQAKKVKLIGIRSFDFSEYNAITSSIFRNIEYLPIVATTIKTTTTDAPDWLKNNLYLDPEYLKKKLKCYDVKPIY